MFKIRPEAATGLLAIEARDELALLATFSVIDVISAEKILWQWQDEKSWWQGLEALTPDMLLLHGYADDKSGNHKGVFAIDLRKKLKKWQQEALSFRAVTNAGIIAAYPDKPEAPLLCLSPETGEIITQTASEINSAQVTLFDDVFTFPEFYGEENPYFGQLAKFVNRFTTDKPVLGFDYLETDQNIMLGFYFLKENEVLQQDLLITDLSGNLLCREVLAEKCNGRGVDNFFIFRNNLIFIQNRTSLIGFVL